MIRPCGASYPPMVLFGSTSPLCLAPATLSLEGRRARLSRGVPAFSPTPPSYSTRPPPWSSAPTARSSASSGSPERRVPEPWRCPIHQSLHSEEDPCLHGVLRTRSRHNRGGCVLQNATIFMVCIPIHNSKENSAQFVSPRPVYSLSPRFHPSHSFIVSTNLLAYISPRVVPPSGPGHASGQPGGAGPGPRGPLCGRGARLPSVRRRLSPAVVAPTLPGPHFYRSPRDPLPSERGCCSIPADAFCPKVFVRRGF